MSPSSNTQPAVANHSQSSECNVEDSIRRVRILHDQVVNQIAAGEVVERPASVVKELVENSIDARAQNISVVISNGGRSSIEVVDDGRGMTREDALLAIERFGTSKISDASDLLSIATHGFRGEALPSIASVSRFQLVTCPTVTQVAPDHTGNFEKPSGTDISIDGGKLRDVLTRAISPGTRVLVRDLFFNVPARRKFLRSENTEAGLVKALISDFALAYPEIRFRLVVDGAEVANYAPGKDFFQRARELKIAGARPIECEHTVETANGPVRIQAFLSEPIESVASSGRLRTLINRRSVRDRLMLKAVRDGFGAFIRPGRYPSGAVLLLLPPEDVDVNVHPQKTEVRFRRPDLVFGVVTKAISQAVRARGVGDFPGQDNLSEVAQVPPRVTSASWVPASEATRVFHDKSLPLLFEGSGRLPADSLDANNRRVPQIDLSRFRFVGQVLHCYLILEGGGMVAWVDMHAAHERVKFFLLKTELLQGKLHSQLLLLPETIDLPADRAAEFEKFQPVIRRLGIDAEMFGENTIVVRAVPSLLHGLSVRELMNDLLAIPEWGDWEVAVDRKWDEAIARLACHRSIRSGRDLESEEVYELLRSLQDADASGYCPHGRPIVKVYRAEDIEAMFGRIQA